MPHLHNDSVLYTQQLCTYALRLGHVDYFPGARKTAREVHLWGTLHQRYPLVLFLEKLVSQFSIPQFHWAMN